MKLIKLRQLAVAVFLGMAVWGLLLFVMGQQAAYSAPPQQQPEQPILKVSKQSAGNWLKRVKLVFTNTVSEELTDFPVLVVLDSERISYTETLDEGQDIRFVDADGTMLPHEIESWNEAGSSYVWVKVPSIPASSSIDTGFIWLYYGNPDAPDGQQPAAVWTSGYRGVWHLNGNLEDSSALQNDGQADSITTNSPGRIAGGQNFDGDQDYINAGSNIGVDDVFTTGGTILAWINPRTFGKAGYGRIADKSDTTTAGSGWAFELYQETTNNTPRNTIRFERDFSRQRGSWYAPVGSIITDSWQLVAVTFDDQEGAQIPSFYLNGVATAVITEDVKNGDPESDELIDLYLGNFPEFAAKPQQQDDRSFDGFMDEIRLVGRVQSADWIQAQYRTMTDNFIQYIPPEATSLSPGGIVGAPLTYTLTVSNTGNVLADDVEVIDPLPAGAFYVRGGDEIVNGTVRWTIPTTIAAGSSQTYTFVVTTCQAVLVNRDYQVLASAGVYTSPLGELAITLLTTPTLTAAFEHDPLPVVIGETFSFTSTSTTNGGPIRDWQWTFGDNGTAQGQTVTHTYSGPGIYTTTLTVTDSCGYTASASKALNVFSPVLTVTKYGDPEPVGVGKRLNYTVVISNSGQSPATGVVVSDTLPTAVTLIPGSVEIIPPGVGNVVEALPEIANDLTVAGQSLVTVTYGVTVNGPLASGTVLTNTVDVYGLQTPVPVRDIVTSTVINLNDTANLSINKLGTPQTVLPGQRLTYTVVVKNNGNGIATGGRVIDLLPDDVTPVADSIVIEPDNAGSPGILPTLANNLTISAGAQITVTFAVTVSSPLTPGLVLTNTAAVTSQQTPVSQIDTTTNTVVAPPALQIIKEGPGNAAVGDIVQFTFIVKNSGYVRLQDVEVIDDVTGVPVLIDDGNNDNWLDLNETWVYTASYTIQATDPAELVNTAVVTAVDPLNVMVTDRVSHTTLVNFGPVLNLTKTGPITAAVGETVRFTLTVEHAPTSDQTPVSILSVTDDIAGPATPVLGGDRDGDERLDWGEVWTYTVVIPNIKPTMPNPLVNTGRVEAVDPAERIVTATAQHTTTLSGFNPSLFIDVDGPTQARLQERITLTYTVINVNILALLRYNLSEVGVAEIGDGSPIEQISIIPNILADPAKFVDGDFNRNGWLDAAEAWIYTTSYTVSSPAPDPLPITVTALGRDAEGDVISKTDTLVLDIIYVPDLEIDSVFPPTATVGQLVPFTLTVSHANTSDNLPAVMSSVKNSVFGLPVSGVVGDENGNNTLDPGEMWTYRFNYYTIRFTDPPQLIHVTTINSQVPGGDSFVTQVQGLIQVDKPPLNNRLYLPSILKNSSN